MKKVFITFLSILSLILINPVYAETVTSEDIDTNIEDVSESTTIYNKTGARLEDNSGYQNLCTRTSSNNYGVKKKWDMSDSTRINYAQNTPCVDSKDKVYDFSDLLTLEEENEMKKLMDEYSKKYNMDVIFVSYNLPYTNDDDNLYFADDFYDFNSFGLDYDKYDGVVIFRNTYYADPFYTVISEGEAQIYLTGNRLSNIEDYIYDDFVARRYVEGVKSVLNELDYYYKIGPEKGYYVDDMGKVHTKWYPTFIIYIIIGMVAGIIYIIVGLGKHRMVKKATAARDYFVKDSLNLTEKNDIFLRSHTSSYTVSSSSGGGGGSFSSHSGGGFSSGGGRHG